MMKLFAIALVIFLGGCSNPLAMLTGGGPNVAANVQAGKENTQQVVANQVRTEEVEWIDGNDDTWEWNGF